MTYESSQGTLYSPSEVLEIRDKLIKELEKTIEAAYGATADRKQAIYLRLTVLIEQAFYPVTEIRERDYVRKTLNRRTQP